MEEIISWARGFFGARKWYLLMYPWWIFLFRLYFFFVYIFPHCVWTFFLHLYILWASSHSPPVLSFSREPWQNWQICESVNVTAPQLDSPCSGHASDTVTSCFAGKSETRMLPRSHWFLVCGAQMCVLFGHAGGEPVQRARWQVSGMGIT